MSTEVRKLEETKGSSLAFIRKRCSRAMSMRRSGSTAEKRTRSIRRLQPTALTVSEITSNGLPRITRKRAAKLNVFFADEDYVLLHCHYTGFLGENGDAIIDIFRVEDGKVVEHWDVIQAIPKTSLNENTMF